MDVDKMHKRINDRRRSKPPTPPENARSTLKAFVLFSELVSGFTAFRMPIMIARIKTSPAEPMAKERLETRLRSTDSKQKCLSRLNWKVTL
jgi:hypothetical protein